MFFFISIIFCLYYSFPFFVLFDLLSPMAGSILSS
ncbi:hypothetical protein EVA_06755 [gut metagenome]|uniref:Uncharacterized protein n=1 Tax=gut metagenome TaxID=749906 RepID=J9GCS7_9ZZZZ